MRLLDIKIETLVHHLLVGVCIAISFSTFSNQYSTLETRSEFENNRLGILYAIEERNGALFLGGENGLLRILGNKVNYYQSSSLGRTIKETRSILSIDDSSVWLASQESGVIHITSINSEDFNVEYIDSLSSLSCTRLVQIEEKSIAAICEAQAYIINLESKSLDFVQTTKLNKVLGQKRIDAIIFHRERNALAVLTEAGIYILDSNFEPQELVSVPKDRGAKNFYMINDKNFLVAGKRSVFLVSKDRQNLWSVRKEYLLGENSVNNLVPLSDGNILVLADRPYIFDSRLDTLAFSEHLASELKSLGTVSVYDAVESMNGELFLVANIAGLIAVPGFTRTLHLMQDDEGQNFKNIDFSLKTSPNEILISEGGNIYLNNIDKAHTRILATDNGYANSLFIDDEGNVGISIAEKGLSVFSGSLEQKNTDKFGLKFQFKVKDGEIYGAVVDDRGSIFFGVAGGKKKGLYEYNPKNQLNIIRNDIHVDAITQGRNGSLFVATRFSGVLEMQAGSAKWKKWQDDFGDNHLIKYCIEEDRSGVIWLCTNGHGLGFLDKSSGKIKYIDSSFTADSKFIRELVQDSDGYFWVMTNQGLVRYDHQNQHSIKLGKEEGIIDTDFEVTASINLDDDRILIAGDKLNYILETKSANKYLNERANRTSEAYVVDLAVFERGERNIQNSSNNRNLSIQADEGITLSYDDFLFTLGFAANNYIDRNLLGFEYRLLGLDDSWVRVSTKSPTATFSTLPHGNYTFQLRVFDPKSIAAQPITNLNVRILPPFWLTWQAYLVYALCFFLIIWQASRIRSQKIKQANILLERAVDKKVHELEKSTVFVSDLLDQKRILFANVSHEFRTPLSLIMAPIEILRNSLSNQYQLQQARLIKRNANRLRVLVEQVLDLIKIEDVKTPEYENYSIKESLASLIETFLPYAQSKKQSIEFNCKCNGVVKLRADSFEKITSNILINALKYTQHQGRVEITASNENNTVHIKIKDNGPGIEESEHQRIFERFVRSTAAKNTAGTGLGLAVANELVLVNGGQLNIESVLSEGTEFTISLPMDDQNDETLDIKETKFEHVEIEDLIEDSDSLEYIQKPKKLDAPSVLIIEDNSELREFLSDTLSDKFNCETACDGQEGLRLAYESIPDLVITDLMMPEIDGHQFTEMLRNEDTTAHVPIIMLTAKSDDEIRKHSWQKEIDDFVAKPFDIEELILRIDRILSFRERLRKQYAKELGESFESNTNKSLSFGSKKDEDFYSRFKAVIEKNYESDSFGRKDAASNLALSERQLNRKLAALIDHNFSDYLKKFRMNKASEFLLEGRQLTEVSFDVGFTSPSYFSSCFKAEFDVTPSEFVEANLQQKV